MSNLVAISRLLLFRPQCINLPSWSYVQWVELSRENGLDKGLSTRTCFSARPSTGHTIHHGCFRTLAAGSRARDTYTHVGNARCLVRQHSDFVHEGGIETRARVFFLYGPFVGYSW